MVRRRGRDSDRRCRPLTSALSPTVARALSVALLLLAGIAPTLAAQVAPAASDLHALAESPVMESQPAVADAFRSFASAQLTRRRTSYDAALLDFDKAIREAPRAAIPRWGRALVKLAMSERGFIVKPGAGSMRPGQSFYASYVTDLVAAATLERPPGRATSWLIRATAMQGDRVQPVEATELLAIAATGRAPPADVFLALGRQRRLQGDDGAALNLFQEFARAGGDRGVAAIEQARALAGVLRLSEAAARYLDGSANESDAAAEIYRRDLGWIADSAELQSFDRIAAPERRQWLQNFFLVRDAESIRLPGERLQDHLRRWVFVHRHFRIPNPERWSGFLRASAAPIAPCTRSLPDDIDPVTLAYDPTRLADARSSEGVLDHRAIIYMRHGEPDLALGRATAWRDTTSLAREAAIGPADDGAGAAEALIWVYWIGDGPKVFSFVPTLPKSQFGPRALSLAPITYAPLLWLLGDVDPRFKRAAARIETFEAGSIIGHAVPNECNPTIQNLAVLTERSAIAGATSDSHTLTFKRSLDPVLQLTPVGDPSRGEGRALVVFAIPGDRLPPTQAWPGGVSYQLQLRISALDRSHGTVRMLDTVRTFVLHDSIGSGQFLSGFQELALPAGSYDIGVALMTGSHRAGGWRKWSGVAVGSPAGTLAMSGIVLAQETGGLPWPNRGDALALNALDAYPAGSVVPLYYEASGLARNDAYRTTIVVTPSGSSAGQSTQVAFTERATGGAQHFRRSVGLGALKQGQHRLVVTIEHLASGETVSAERTINLTGRRAPSEP